MVYNMRSLLALHSYYKPDNGRSFAEPLGATAGLFTVIYDRRLLFEAFTSLSLLIPGLPI